MGCNAVRCRSGGIVTPTHVRDVYTPFCGPASCQLCHAARTRCRGPAKTKLGNGCLLVDGVLAAFAPRWAKSAAVLHAAVGCLKEMLRLTGREAGAGGRACSW